MTQGVTSTRTPVYGVPVVSWASHTVKEPRAPGLLQGSPSDRRVSCLPGPWRWDSTLTILMEVKIKIFILQLRILFLTKDSLRRNKFGDFFTKERILSSIILQISGSLQII